MKYKYAIQHKVSGQLVDYCDTEEQAAYWLNMKEDNLEVVEIANSSKILVEYTELGGPWGYGHQEPSFETYGSLLKCIRNLYKWMQGSARVFGPDARDIKDFFLHCKLYINGEDNSEWLWKQIEKLNLKTIYV